MSRIEKVIMPPPKADPVKMLVTMEDLCRFLCEVLYKVIKLPAHAITMTEVMLAADYTGYWRYGVRYLPTLVEIIQNKYVNPKSTPCLLTETISTAYVTGRNALGPVVGDFCLELAMRKAEENGVAMVVVKESNNLGMVNWFAAKALSLGYLAIVFTNSTPVLCPPKATKGVLGMNHFTVAAPSTHEDKCIMDLSTSAVKYLTIEDCNFKGKKIPLDWGMDSTGNTTQDPSAVLNDGSLFPLGGREFTRGDKGYGLSIVVELLCGALSGGPMGSHVPNTRENPYAIQHLSHNFLVIDTSCFAPGFADRMAELYGTIQNSKPVKEGGKVKMPGDSARQHIRLVDERGGVVFDESIFSELDHLAASLRVDPIQRTVFYAPP